VVGKEIGEELPAPSAFGTSPKYDDIKLVCGFKLIIAGFGRVCV
jgi:hypothetical protein